MIYKKAERNYKMSNVLRTGGFEDEAVKPLTQSVELAAKSLLVLASKDLLEEEPRELTKDSINLIKTSLNLKENLIMFLTLYCLNKSEKKEPVIDLYSYAKLLHNEVTGLIAKQGL
jgi:HEPN domain-containing protein